MAQFVSVAWDEQSADHDLISFTRDGDTDAFAVLYGRHSGAARTVARQYLPNPADAEDVVSEAFAKVLTTLRHGAGPDAAFRAYLFTVVRRLSFQAVDQSRRVTPSEDDVFEIAFGPSASSEEPTLRKLEYSLVVEAYKSLPERWQSVLWYSEIEGMAPADFATLVGLSANGAAALAYRAREGLRQSYLQHHLQSLQDPACAAVAPLFSKYVRGGTSRRDTTAVELHLVGCQDCSALVIELEDLSSSMRMAIAPLVMGVAGLAALDLLPAAEIATVAAGGAAGWPGLKGGRAQHVLWSVGALAVVVVVGVGAVIGLLGQDSTPHDASVDILASVDVTSPQVADSTNQAPDEGARTPSSVQPFGDSDRTSVGPLAAPTMTTRPDGSEASPSPVLSAGADVTDLGTGAAQLGQPSPPTVGGGAAVNVTLTPTSALVARQTSNIGLRLSNSGGKAAQSVTVDVTLPTTVTYVSSTGPVTPLLTRMFAPTTQPGCTPSVADGITVVHCVVGEIAAGRSSEVSLDVLAQVSGTIDIATSTTIGSVAAHGAIFNQPVAQAPARLEVSASAVAALRAGVRGYVAVTVDNVGEVAAEKSRLELTLPSGFAWAADAWGDLDVDGTAWGCSAQIPGDRTVATCAASAPVAGDGTEVLYLPVEVGAAAAPERGFEVASRTAFLDGDWKTSPVSTVPLASAGLSMTALLSGHLQTATIASSLDCPVDLSIPEGAVVRYAELTWSGTTSHGGAGEVLSSVGLHVVGRDQARWTVDGTVVADASGPSSYWARADVTTLVSQHTGVGAWSVVPAPGAVLPVGLAWSLTVIYESAGAPDATVVVLSAPTGGGEQIALPVTGDVSVSGTGFSGAIASGMPLSMSDALVQLPGALPYTTRFHSPRLVSAEDESIPGRGLMITPSPSTIGLVVHATTDTAAVAVGVGAVEQPQRPRLANLGVTITATSSSTGEGMLRVRVSNPTNSTLSSLRMTLDLPSSVQVLGETGCTAGASMVCGEEDSLDPGGFSVFEVKLAGTVPGSYPAVRVTASAVDNATGMLLTGTTSYVLPVS